MKKINNCSLLQQSRCRVSRHIYWQDKRYKSSLQETDKIKMLAQHPGLHSGNENRRNIAQSLLGIITLLTNIQNVQTITVSKEYKPSSKSSKYSGEAEWNNMVLQKMIICPNTVGLNHQHSVTVQNENKHLFSHVSAQDKSSPDCPFRRKRSTQGRPSAIAASFKTGAGINIISGEDALYSTGKASALVNDLSGSESCCLSPIINFIKVNTTGIPKEDFHHFDFINEIDNYYKKNSFSNLKNQHLARYYFHKNEATTLEFSLPKKNLIVSCTGLFLRHHMKRGNNTIDFSARFNSHIGESDFLHLHDKNKRLIVRLFQIGRDYFINYLDIRRQMRIILIGQTPAPLIFDKFNIQIKREKGWGLEIRLNQNLVFRKTIISRPIQIMLGIRNAKVSKYFRTVEFKDITITNSQNNKLCEEWHRYIAGLTNDGIHFTKGLHPFSDECFVFFNSKKNKIIRNQRHAIIHSLYHRKITKRDTYSIYDINTLSVGIFQTVNTLNLIRILSSSEISQKDKENAAIDFVKLGSQEAFIYGAGLIELADPFKLVSGKYGAGVKALLRSGGLSLVVLFSALNLAEGISDNDWAKALSGTISIASVIPSTTLSMMNAFAVGHIFTALSLMFDGLSGSKKQGDIIAHFFNTTILNKEINKQFDYVWTAKSNQNGVSPYGNNLFFLNLPDEPDKKQIITDKFTPLFMRDGIFGSTLILPESVGSVDGKTYDTAPDTETTSAIGSVYSYANGFKGFRTRVREENDPNHFSHLIYTSNMAIPEPHKSAPNKAVDDINPDNFNLNGNDAIFSHSYDSFIHAGNGDDVVFISGEEKIIDGGSGFNIAVINPGTTKITLNIFGQDSARIGDKTILKNFNVYLLKGKGHEVIFDPNKFQNKIPVFISIDGDCKLFLHNPVSFTGDTIITQYSARVPFGNSRHKVYCPALNEIRIKNKLFAMHKNFDVQTVYR